MSKENKKTNWVSIIGMVVVVAALTVGIKTIFDVLEQKMSAMQGDRPAVTTFQLNTEAGQAGDYTLTLPDGERDEDVAEWLEAAMDKSAVDAQWLSRDGEYVLYLPMQDRAVTHEDLTATEEQGEDGEAVLVLRIRTPEGSEAIDPAQQLFYISTTSTSWKGTRVAVILDGRELDVQTTISQDGQLFSADK